MSFLIAVHVNEGIVLASDRRTTYTNTQTCGDTIIQRIGIHTTNSTDKTFPCPNGAGISTCGDASLLGKPITGFIQDMIRSRIGDDCPVSSIPQVIIDYFNELPLVPDTHFIVAGYDKTESGKQQLLYKVRVKEKSIDQINTDSQGAFWDGETYTLTRLIQNVAIKTTDNNYLDLPFETLWVERERLVSYRGTVRTLESDPKKSKDLCILVTPQSLKKSINIFDRMTKD